MAVVELCLWALEPDGDICAVASPEGCCMTSVLGLLRNCSCRHLVLPCCDWGGRAASSGGAVCPEWPSRGGKALFWPNIANGV